MAEFDFDLFVLHANGDAKFVHDLLDKMGRSASSSRVMLPTKYELGRTALDEVERAIRTSRFTLLVVSSASRSEPWTEHGSLLARTLEALDRKQRLIPLLRDSSPLSLDISSLVSLDFTNRELWPVETSRLCNHLDRAEDRRDFGPAPQVLTRGLRQPRRIAMIFVFLGVVVTALAIKAVQKINQRHLHLRDVDWSVQGGQVTGSNGEITGPHGEIIGSQSRLELHHPSEKTELIGKNLRSSHLYCRFKIRFLHGAPDSSIGLEVWAKNEYSITFRGGQIKLVRDGTYVNGRRIEGYTGRDLEIILQSTPDSILAEINGKTYIRETNSYFSGQALDVRLNVDIGDTIVLYSAACDDDA